MNYDLQPLVLVPVLDGLVWGVMLVMIAAGLTLIFGFMEIINFAHGALYMLGGYVVFTVMGVTGSFWLGLLLAPLVVGVIALIIEWGLLRPSYDSGPIKQLLVLLGVTLVIEGAVVLIWGARARSVDTPSALAFSIPLGVGQYPAYWLFLLIIGSVTVVAIWAFMRYSRIGLVVRASMTDKTMARALGHDIPTIYTQVFVGSVMIAALAGALMVPIRSIGPETGVQILLLAFVIVVVGGLGSFKGTVAAGLLIGMTDILITRFISFRFAGITMFAILLIVLITRPRGLFGEKGVME